MPDKTWKATERRMARDVGTERKPCDGSRAGADWDDGLCVYQLKVRRSIPSWLWRWLFGIQGTAAAVPKAPWGARIGVLVLKHPKQRDEEAVVVLGWRDWCDLHGNWKRAEQDVLYLGGIVSAKERYAEKAKTETERP